MTLTILSYCSLPSHGTLSIESDVYEKALNKVTIDRVEPDGQQDEMAHN